MEGRKLQKKEIFREICYLLKGRERGEKKRREKSVPVLRFHFPDILGKRL